ncbi:MAG: sigma-70 family RNA polymerase sigma factor [Bacteroidota bacterium]
MIEAQTVDDEQLLNGLLKADHQLIAKVYDLALPAVIAWIKENSGTETDARDVFQEALIALFQKLEKGDFKLTCTLKSFLRIICRNLWLTRLRNKGKMLGKPLEEVEFVQLDNDLQDRIERSERERLFYQHFDALGENCRKILQWFFDKIPLKTIAQRLDSTEGYIKKRKFLCKEKLVKAIQADARFNELKNN